MSFTRRVHLFIRVLFLTALMWLSTSAHASHNSFQSEEKTWHTSISLGGFTVDPSLFNEGIGERGFGIDLSVGYRFNPHFIGVLGLGFANFDDQNSFSQQVVGQFGGPVSRQSSDVVAIPLFAEAQYEGALSIVDNLHYRLGAGYTTLTLAERSISNCVDCSTDEVNINGGAYLAGSLLMRNLGKIDFGVALKQYVSGDLENALSIWIEY